MWVVKNGDVFTFVIGQVHRSELCQEPRAPCECRFSRTFLSGVREAAQNLQELYFYSWGLEFTGIHSEPFPCSSGTFLLLLFEEKKINFNFF